MKELLSRLNKETFIFDLAEPMKKSPLLEGFNINLIDDTTIEIEIDRTRNLNELFNLFAKVNINIKSMRNKRNRLEELFINLLNDKQRK